MNLDKKPNQSKKRSLFSRNPEKPLVENEVAAPEDTKPAPVRRRRRRAVEQPKPAVQPKPVEQPKPAVQPKPVEKPKPAVQPKPVEKLKAPVYSAKERLLKIKQVRQDLMNNKFFLISRDEAAPIAARMVDLGAESLLQEKDFFSAEAKRVLCEDLSKKHNLKL